LLDRNCEYNVAPINSVCLAHLRDVIAGMLLRTWVPGKYSSRPMHVNIAVLYLRTLYVHSRHRLAARVSHCIITNSDDAD